MIQNFVFDEKRSVIFQRAWSGRAFDPKVFSYLEIFARLLLVISAIFLILGFILFFTNWYEINTSLLSLGILIFLISSIYLILRWFFHTDFKNPPMLIKFNQNITNTSGMNFADFLSYRASRAILCAKAMSKGSKITAREIIFGTLNDSRVNFILARLGLSIDKISQALSQNSEDNFEHTIELAFNMALKQGHSRIKVTDLFAAASIIHEPLNELILNSGLRDEDIANLVYWENSLEIHEKTKKEFYKPENRTRTTRGVGYDWSAGWTPILDRYSTDITDQVSFQHSLDIIGKKNYIDLLQQGLARSMEANVLLVGPPGIGKKTMVLGLAQLIIHKKSLPVLNNKRIKELNISALISGSSNVREVEERVLAVFNEVINAGNIVLYIDNIQDIFRMDESAGTVDVSEVIGPYLVSPKFQVIGATTQEEYRSYILPKREINENFSQITVKEPEDNDLIKIIEEIVPYLEYKNPAIITYRAIKEAIDLTRKFQPNQAFPEKAITLLDEGLTDAVVNKKQRYLTPEILQELVTKKTSIPVAKVTKDEKQTLLNLEKILHSRVIGQNEAINVIADAMRRARAGLHSGKRPIGSFLFLGPTGVGKTETCKAMAAAYFGSEKSMVRIDMSEYRDMGSINRLIGDPYDPKSGGSLTTAVRENPFSLILLDEVEKAHPDILNLFLQVFEDGRLTDTGGKTTDFTNSMIIGTSNAGAEVIRQEVQKGTNMQDFKKDLMEILQREGIFKPEFLNRFDAVVVFKPLLKEELVKVADLMLKNLALTLETKRIKLDYTPEVLQKMVELGYNPEYGARPMRRLIQEKIENIIARAMLEENLKEGSTYTLKPEDIS
ncbi:MAG: AAA family ATPase [bacterium]